MTTIKSLWKKIPTYESLFIRFDGHGQGRFIVGSALIVWFIVAMFLPRFAPESYGGAKAVIVVSDFLRLALLLFLLRNIDTEKWSQNLDKMLWWLVCIGAIGQAFLTFSHILPVTADSSASHRAEIGRVYIAYDHDCPYCRAAHGNMQKAVSVYNMTHKNKANVINLDGKDELSKSVKHYVAHRGVTVTMKKNNKSIERIYTQGNNQGPLTPSASHIYNTIVKSAKDAQGK